MVRLWSTPKGSKFSDDIDICMRNSTVSLSFLRYNAFLNTEDFKITLNTIHYSNNFFMINNTTCRTFQCPYLLSWYWHRFGHSLWDLKSNHNPNNVQKKHVFKVTLDQNGPLVGSFVQITLITKALQPLEEHGRVENLAWGRGQRPSGLSKYRSPYTRLR
jgi:hypothetical protein